MAEHPIPQQELFNRVYKGKTKTGDNIDALVVMPYGFGTDDNWARIPTPFIDASYDSVAFSNPDGNGNYQTIVFSANSVTVRTLTLTFDSNSNVMSIVRM